MSIAFNDRPKVIHSAGRHGEKFWDEEKNNLGLKLMKQMGWDRGKGLGRTENGTTNFIRSKLKIDQKGIGLTELKKDEVWSAAQDMYNDLLQRLQEENKNGTIVEENVVEKAKSEETTQSPSNVAALNNFRAKRMLYSKFKKAKDMKAWSATAMSEVFGKKQSAIPPCDAAGTSQTPSDSVHSQDIILKTSKLNLKDYFAQKLQGKPGASPSLSKPSSSTSRSSSISQQEYFDRMTDISAAQGKNTGNNAVPGGAHFGLGFASIQDSNTSAASNDDNEMVRRIREASQAVSAKKENGVSSSTKQNGNDSEKNESDEDEAERKRKKKARKEAKRLRRIQEEEQQAEARNKNEQHTFNGHTFHDKDTDSEQSEAPKKRRKTEKTSSNNSDGNETAESMDDDGKQEESEEQRKLRKQKRKEEKRRLKEERRQAEAAHTPEAVQHTIAAEESGKTEKKKKQKAKSQETVEQVDESA